MSKWNDGYHPTSPTNPSDAANSVEVQPWKRLPQLSFGLSLFALCTTVAVGALFYFGVLDVPWNSQWPLGLVVFFLLPLCLLSAFLAGVSLMRSRDAWSVTSLLLALLAFFVSGLDLFLIALIGMGNSPI